MEGVSHDQTTIEAMSAGRCPFHQGVAPQKTAPVQEPTNLPLHQDAAGTWHVRGYREARAVLRANETTQAGFKAEEMGGIGFMNKPILYMEGEPHHEQRRRTARFFTPKATRAYREVMEAYSEQVLAPLRTAGRADVSLLSMQMAVEVAAQIVGLTESRSGGLAQRLASFFENVDTSSSGPRAWFQQLRNSFSLGLFFLLDVQPAIKARRAEPREDVISHLIESGYSNGEILAECIMYGAAGMVTTREFIVATAWHLLETPERRDWFLASDEETRYAFLHEALRLEPVVGHLYRRATADLAVPSEEGTVTVPAGSLIDLHIYAINADLRAVGEAPLDLCPMRAMQESRTPPEVMSFGDGHHRCAGAYVAIQETDIFLRDLLSIPGLQVERWPTLGYNPLAKGYELRQFIVTVAR